MASSHINIPSGVSEIKNGTPIISNISTGLRTSLGSSGSVSSRKLMNKKDGIPFYHKVYRPVPPYQLETNLGYYYRSTPPGYTRYSYPPDISLDGTKNTLIL